MTMKSSIQLLGLPLVHVATGQLVDGRYRRGVARGWIAVGDVAFGVSSRLVVLRSAASVLAVWRWGAGVRWSSDRRVCSGWPGDRSRCGRRRGSGVVGRGGWAGHRRGCGPRWPGGCDPRQRRRSPGIGYRTDFFPGGYGPGKARPLALLLAVLPVIMLLRQRRGG